jgi:hypothetical protein
MHRQLVSRVRDALDDVAPDLAESAVGRAVQAGALVQMAAGLLSDELGAATACKILGEMAERALAVR